MWSQVYGEKRKYKPPNCRCGSEPECMLTFRTNPQRTPQYHTLKSFRYAPIYWPWFSRHLLNLISLKTLKMVMISAGDIVCSITNWKYFSLLINTWCQNYRWAVGALKPRKPVQNCRGKNCWSSMCTASPVHRSKDSWNTRNLKSSHQKLWDSVCVWAGQAILSGVISLEW